MITQFDKFLNENTSHGTPLTHYFNKNSLRHENILGKKVIDITDGTTWFIKDIDPIIDAKIFFKETFYKGDDPDFMLKNIYINWGKVEFYGKSFGLREIRIEELKKFFENNNQIIRKEKLLEIESNRYFR